MTLLSPTGKDNSRTTLTRRQTLAAGCAMLATPEIHASRRRPRRIAAITTVYPHNSHADVLLSRLLEGENLDFHSRRPDLELVSLYVDQFPQTDISRQLSGKYGFRLCSRIEDALT